MAEFLEYPLAYHITFGTYGTRLHGDERGTVSRLQTRFGEPIIGKDVVGQRRERLQLKSPPVILSDPQRRRVEQVVPETCKRGGWEYHIAAARPDHVHALLTTAHDGKRVRKWLKTWLGQELSRAWPRPTWWAEGGSVKSVWNDEYFANVFQYIRSQRTSAFPATRGK